MAANSPDIKVDIKPDFYIDIALDTGCGCGGGCLPQAKSKRRGKSKRDLALAFASLHASEIGGLL
jgi:hypothetical protein